MALLNLVIFPDERLRQKCTDITEFDDKLKTLVEDMFDTMYQEDGIGLAAPQIGLSKRLVVIDVPVDELEHKKLALINPKIISKENEIASEEGCLSVPEYRAEVTRYNNITFTYQDVEGVVHTEEASDLFAICVQHELDHLDGKLFIDYLSKLKRERLLTKYKKLKKANSHDE